MDEKIELMLNGYRESNRELTKTNQEMRINAQKFFAETLRLQAELMKKHETEIILRKLLYQSIIDNCLQLTEIVKPDADILPLLRESLKNSDTCFSHSARRSKNSQRRSTQLTAELRRSNSFLSSRDSVRSISPLRRRSTADALNESSGKDADEEQRVEKQLTLDDEQKGPIGILFEESDEEDCSGYVLSSESEQDNTESIPGSTDGVIQPCESVSDTTNTIADTVMNSRTHSKESPHVLASQTERGAIAETIMNSRTRSKEIPHVFGSEMECGTIVETIMNSRTHSKDIPHVLGSETEHGNIEIVADVSDGVIRPCESLSDVTNTLAKNIMNRKAQDKNIQNIKGQKHKTSSKLENSREPDNNKKQNPSKKRGKPLKNKRKTSESSAGEDEVQGPRTSSCGRASQTTNNSIPIAQSNNLADEVTINSIDFFEARSSTPIKEPETSISSSTRPVRKCKPKNLVEPSTKTKLRNTMDTKKKSFKPVPR